MKTVSLFIQKHWFFLLLFAVIYIGIFFRLKGFLINPSFWHDECALAWNVKFKTYSELFGGLRFLQVAPPLFLVGAKFFSSLFNFSSNPFLYDLSLRFIPFCCSLLSVFIFYSLAKLLFRSRLGLLLSLFLFSINISLIRYSFEFKQYSSDLLCVLLVALFFIKQDLSKLSYKKVLLFSLGFSVLIWFSFICGVFVLSGLLLFLIKKEFKKFFIFLTPFFISSCFYLYFYILNTYSSNKDGMCGFWESGFLLANLSNFFSLLFKNISFFFIPFNLPFVVFLFCLFGGVVFFKQKRHSFLIFFLSGFFLLLLASVLHLYPFQERLVLFLIPFFILFITKPIDVINKNQKFLSFFIILFLSLITTVQLFYVKDYTKWEHPREFIKTLYQKIKPVDKIVINYDSKIEYLYYSSFYKIENKIFLLNTKNPSKESITSFLQPLDGSFWLYLPFVEDTSVLVEFIKWSAKNKILFYIKEDYSFLINVKVK